MVNAVQTGAEWQPRFAAHGLQPQSQSKNFALAPDNPPEKDDGFKAFGDDGFTLLDAVDIINPLQHLPLIGTLYRELTGDTLDPFSRVAGSTLFFGPLGTAVSSANVAMQEMTGKDFGGHMMAFFKGGDGPAGETEIAQKNQGPAASGATAMATAAGTDSLDPVTAWAIAEIGHRQALAQQQGLEVAAKPYGHLVASAASQHRMDSVNIIPPVKWAPTGAAERTLPAPPQLPSAAGAISRPALEQANRGQADHNRAVRHSAPVALNAFQAEHRASPETLLKLKRANLAYQTIDFPNRDSEPSQKNPERAADPRPFEASRNRLDRDAASDAATGQAAQDNWFSASMLQALGKYRQAATTDKSQLDQLTSGSSLH